MAMRHTWDRWKLGLLGLAALNFGNGAWMLADPRLWYTDLPAAVPDFGPYNEHFVRDLGAVFITLGGALAWAALRPALRLALVSVTAAFYVLHAAGHVFDTLRGYVEPSHWWIDLPGVYVPALILAALAVALARSTPRAPIEQPYLARAEPGVPIRRTGTTREG
jgi:hypothetical protein